MQHVLLHFMGDILLPPPDATLEQIRAHFYGAVSMWNIGVSCPPELVDDALETLTYPGCGLAQVRFVYDAVDARRRRLFPNERRAIVDIEVHPAGKLLRIDLVTTTDASERRARSAAS